MNSGEDPRDLSQQQISLLKEYLDSDLFAFAWFVFGFQDLVPEIHGKIASILGKWGQPGWERVMIQIPRDYYKTSLCTIANSLWQASKDPEKPVCIFNETEKKPKAWLRTIRGIIRGNLLYQTVYRDLLPPGVAVGDNRNMPRDWKWSDEEINLVRDRPQPEASITAMGMGAASAGLHFPKIIKDDLISEDAVASPSVMSTAKEWFDKSLYLERPALKGWDLIPCTTWAYDDLYAHVLRTYNYRLYRRASLENDDGEPDINGETIFPSKHSTAFLLKQHDRDPYGFTSQMQNTPSPGKDRQFDPKWIRWGKVSYADPERPKFIIRVEDYDSTIIGEPGLVDIPPRSIAISLLNKAIYLDPAPTEEGDIKRAKGSRNAILVLGVDAWGRRYILDEWVGKVDPFDVILKIFEKIDTWGTNRVGIEEVLFSKIYRHWLMREARRRSTVVRVDKLKPGKRDKDTRIIRLIPGYRQGLYYHNKGYTQELVKEIVEYPYGTTKDLLDVHAYDYKLARPLSFEEETRQAIRNRVVNDGRNPVTRY